MQSSRFLPRLIARLKTGGPLTVAQYMAAALTDPQYGYYTTPRPVFGARGDFVTSPEISQLLGEMVAVWMINEWTVLGRPKPLQLVELGPGRGSMMEDILRVVKRVSPSMAQDLNVHLVEVSDELSEVQAARLSAQTDSHTEASVNPSESATSTSKPQITSRTGPFRTATSPLGIDLFWHRTLHQVPRGFSLVLAHEFFDALPIHVLKKTEKTWNEVLVDVSDDGKGLRFVLSGRPTPACVYNKYSKGRELFEVSPQAGIVMEELATRLEDDGGIALVIDYGHDGTATDTFRGFSDHRVVDPLSNPGETDLTADVDFSFLREVAGEKLVTLGPVTQRLFLQQLHIDLRLQKLLSSCESEDQRKALLAGYKTLVDPQAMGECFKVAAFYPAVLKDYLSKSPPPGFV